LQRLVKSGKLVSTGEKGDPGMNGKRKITTRRYYITTRSYICDNGQSGMIMSRTGGKRVQLRHDIAPGRLIFRCGKRIIQLS